MVDEAAARRAVRERRRAGIAEDDSVFGRQPRNSARETAPRGVLLRDDIHQRGIQAAKKALRGFREGKSVSEDE